jgi:hypothetical protein
MTEHMAPDRSQARPDHIRPGPRPPGMESPTLAAYLFIELTPVQDPAPSGHWKRFLRRLRSLRARQCGAPSALAAAGSYWSAQEGWASIPANRELIAANRSIRHPPVDICRSSS